MPGKGRTRDTIGPRLYGRVRCVWQTPGGLAAHVNSAPSRSGTQCGGVFDRRGPPPFGTNFGFGEG